MRGLGSETVPHRTSGGFSFSWSLRCHRLCCPEEHGSFLGRLAKWFLLLFGMRRNGPDEAEQLTSQCGHDLVFVFVTSRKRLVAFVQTLLRLPGDLLDILAEGQILLPPQKKTGHVRTVLIRPRRFHQHPSEVTVARFGDASTPHAIPAGLFARNQAAVTHQLTWTLETRHRAKLGDERG